MNLPVSVQIPVLGETLSAGWTNVFPFTCVRHHVPFDIQSTSELFPTYFASMFLTVKPCEMGSETSVRLELLVDAQLTLEWKFRNIRHLFRFL